MTRLLKSTFVLGVCVFAAVLALLQFWRGDRGATGTSGSEAPNATFRRGTVKRWGFRIAGFLVIAAFGGFLFAASGIMSIKASSGHWPITAWLLNFAMRRSVVTHSLGTEAPALNDRALVVKGAGHYEIGCRPCHGSPDLNQQPRIAQAMTPHPPNLSREVSKWEAAELFYIVKHGVKFTGMPAWPAPNRDDEVWAMVAFLLTLPTLTADEYKRLAQHGSSSASGDAPMHELLGPQKVPAAVTESCARCHGVDGNGRGVGAFPKLAGQKPEYLAASLHAYARGWRSSGIMEPIAAGLSHEASIELARYYAGLGARKPQTTSPEPNPESVSSSTQLTRNSAESPSIQNPKFSQTKENSPSRMTELSPQSSPSRIERGRNIAFNGIPTRRVPACSDCHGPSDFPRNPNYPALAGQYADYLVLQLLLFKKQARGGTAYAHLMRPAASGLSEDEMRDVALFYAALAK